ncbi:VOC family protein [Pseudovibrio sp. Tun.PSC04-5.I4]|uniref:VOC family protein n=1 Tax=Pseudovibrio sp. Tun.PSC04-5.I4 TaxID=1798213 RepID=UPI0008875FC7|nr:VOC family protein [Pseudovibrio sp. Tun.PSC04-5.I4]SDR32348.1 hypothetical protein SAMN04515695_4490 [Pseudovibrio sp. Tun.PSC04-5.I4]
MKLYGLRIFVTDMAVAKEFYGDTLELPIIWERPELGAFGVKLENAELIIEVAHGEEERGYVGRFLGASLQVDDIVDTYERLCEEGVDFPTPPEKQEWGGVLAHFHDPFGNVLTLLGEAR